MGVALQASGNEVHHLLRDVYDSPPNVVCKFQDRRKAVKIKKGSVYPYQLLGDKDQIPNYGYIIMAVNHDQWRDAILDLRPFVNPDQTLILMGNIWDDFDWIEENAPCPYLFVFPNFGGTIIKAELHGWLTSRMTGGWINCISENSYHDFKALLRQAGFILQYQEDMKGYLRTHFAWVTGSLIEVAKQKGYQKMTKNLLSLINMYRLIRACMLIVANRNVNVRKFKEGRKACQPVWWNAIKTYLIFCIPGLAKKADANMNLEAWRSYGIKLLTTTKSQHLHSPLLDTYKQVLLLK